MCLIDCEQSTFVLCKELIVMFMRQKRKCVTSASNDVDDDDADENDTSIESIDNHIWFYGPVTRSASMQLHMELYRIYDIERKKKNGRILLHLSTEGGCIYSAFSTHDVMRSMSDVTIEVICEGAVFSSGTIIMLGAPIRRIFKHGILLIHEVAGGCWGKYSELKDELENFDMIATKLKALYATHTKLSTSVLEKLLKTDIQFDAEMSLSSGLVTHMI